MISGLHRDSNSSKLLIMFPFPRIALILLFILVFLPVNINCQNRNITFQQIFLQQGLSQSIVTSIIQDRSGFMWFGTEDGLNRYDGYEFKIFKNNPSDPNSLVYNQITSLIEDRNGKLWVGTFYGGLDQYDPVTNIFSHFQYSPDNQNTLCNNNVNTLFVDSSGNLWIGTDAGLNKLELSSGKITRYQNNPKSKNSLSSNIVKAICEDNSGNLWIGTDDGLNKFDKIGNSFTLYKNSKTDNKSLSSNFINTIYKDRTGGLWIGTHGGGMNKLIPPANNKSDYSFITYKNEPANKNSLSNNDVYSIYEDSKGIFWVGTNGGGINIFNKTEKSFVSFLHNPLNQMSLSYNEIRAIYEDRSGLIWIGSYGGGINLVDRGRKKFNLYTNIANQPNSLNENIVWSILEDNNGILWIGTHGGGLNRLDRLKNQYTHYTHNAGDPNSISSNIVRFVFKDNKDNFWVGTHGGGLNKFNPVNGKFISFMHSDGDPSSIAHNELRSIYQDRAGVIWIGTNGGGLCKMVSGSKDGNHVSFVTYKNNPNNPNSLSNDFVRVIYEDTYGNFWVGTQGGGLNKFDRKNGAFIHYMMKKGDSKSISNDFIFSIFEDSKRRLWLGTWGGGLIQFDASKEIFKNYTTKEGLPSDAIYGTIEDNSGNLWISTNNGLSKFNPDKNTFKNYTVDNGLQNNEFNGGSFFKSKTGEMFFGGIGGFNSFYPDDIKDNTFVPQIALTSFKVLNKEVSFNNTINFLNEITLENKDYLFSFEFASLDFNAPGRNLYAYKMEGLDDNWITTTADKRYAVYTTLPPGSYTFRVKGSNNDGKWNETGASIKIIIMPPFWKTWYFILFVLLIIGGIILFSVKRHLANVRMAAELSAAHEAQMALMPRQEPQTGTLDISSFCLPASEVGGDFFDYMWLNKEKSNLGIVIADVSGKGMKAAMTATMCSGMLNSLVFMNCPVKDIMTRANRSIFSRTERKMFTALLFVGIDLETRVLTLTNAGLNPPFLKSGTGIMSLESAGPKLPLGAMKKTEYLEKSYQLLQGDVLLLFTDGVTEAQNNEKKFYSDSNLRNIFAAIDTTVISAKEIKNVIINDIKKFTLNKIQHDDITLIVVKVL